MAENKAPICEDVLEKLSFERCKWWSSFFESIEEREEGEVYKVDEIDEIFKDEISEEEEMDNVEEAVEVDVPEDMKHHSILNSATDDGKNSFVESSDVQDILNVTRPILEEHERKWKKAGLERILNTFDSVRIEEEVGGWMRRNSSAMTVKVESDTDTESSISCDTGRYIRSTQKNGFRQRSKCITSIKKFKNSQRIRHKHGMLIEATTYRAYKCNCCKYNVKKPNSFWEAGPFQQPDTTDTDDDGSQRKLTSPFLLACKRRLSNSRRYVQNCDSSSDSDNASPKNRKTIRRKQHRPNTELSSFKKSLATCGKPWSNMHSREYLVPMIEPKYETPPRSSVAENNINTAPSKLTKMRQAAKEALAKICTENKKKTTTSKKIGGFSKKNQPEKNSSDCNSSYERNVKKAIALSLKTYKKNHGTISKVKDSSGESISKNSKTSTETLELCNDLNTDSVSVVSVSSQESEQSFRTAKNRGRISKKVKDSSGDSVSENSKTSTETLEPCNDLNTDSISSQGSEQSSRTAKRFPKTRKMLNRTKSSEDTFLTNAENICNSTALNGVAQRNQLVSRLPTISESLENLPTTPRCSERQNKDDCDRTAFKRSAVPKQVMGCLPTKSKYLTSRSKLPHTMSTEFEKFNHSTALSDAKAGKDFIMRPKQRKMILSGPSRQAVSEPRRKLKRQVRSYRRKSTTDDRLASQNLVSSDTSTKETTSQRSDTKKKPQRIQLYTPQQKEHAPDGYFQVTRELLSSVIGEKDACRFFKHHLGRLSFPSTSTVYYCSPEVELSSSDSDDDPLQKAGRCGELYESVSHHDNSSI